MNKEDLQSSHGGTGLTENKEQIDQQRENITTDVSNEQQKEIARQAGLGRDRMFDIEDLERMSDRDDYAGGNNDDFNTKN